MSSLLTGASRGVPATRLLRQTPQVDHGRPALRRRFRGNPLLGALLQAFFALARPLLLWQQRLRDRATLQRLPDHLLRDIGLERSEVEAEADKPFWRA